MSANPPTLLNPISSALLDADLGQQADNVTGLGHTINLLCNYYLNVLTEENRAAGLIIDPPQYAGSPPTTMSADDMAAYRTKIGQLQYVGDLLTQAQDGTPAATDLVLPWTRQQAAQQAFGPMYGR
jgi:hypothetical protein